MDEAQRLAAYRARHDWPQPTGMFGEEPDMEEYMEATLYGDEGSYATDGCDIEPDGVCSHGYPSWELWWGVI